MRKVQAFMITLAMGATLAVSAAAMTINPQNSNQSTEACCDMKDCCKSGEMSCCKKKTKKGKNAHACCKGGNGAECCCKGDSCTMPNKKTGTPSGN